MKRCMEKCNVLENALEILPELSDDGTRTRMPDLETTARKKVEMRFETAVKRFREVGDGELDFTPEFAKLRRTRRRVAIDAVVEIPLSPEDVSAGCRPFKSEEEKMSCCSSNASTELVEERSVIDDPAVRTGTSDLILPLSFCPKIQQRESAQLETLTFSGGINRSETTPSSEPCGEESGDLESTAVARPSAEANTRHKPTVAEMPPDSEMEEFFSTAEKNLQKAFLEKYNFDIVKGVPLEGRYEWVRVNP